MYATRDSKIQGYNRPFLSSCKAAVWLQWNHSACPRPAGSTQGEGVVWVEGLPAEQIQTWTEPRPAPRFGLPGCFCSFGGCEVSVSRELRGICSFAHVTTSPLIQCGCCVSYSPLRCCCLCCRDGGNWGTGKSGWSDHVHLFQPWWFYDFMIWSQTLIPKRRHRSSGVIYSYASPSGSVTYHLPLVHVKSLEDSWESVPQKTVCLFNGDMRAGGFYTVFSLKIESPATLYLSWGKMEGGRSSSVQRGGIL